MVIRSANTLNLQILILLRPHPLSDKALPFIAVVAHYKKVRPVDEGHRGLGDESLVAQKFTCD